MEKRVELEKRNRSVDLIDELNLDNCRSTSIEGLTDEFVNLKTLSLNGVGLTSLKGFPTLPNLRKLEMSDNRISGGLQVLKDCARLTLLNLSNNKIKELETLEALKELVGLKSLDLYRNDVTQIEDYRTKVFGLLPGLTYLDGTDKQNKEFDESDVEEEEIAPINGTSVENDTKTGNGAEESSPEALSPGDLEVGIIGEFPTSESEDLGDEDNDIEDEEEELNTGCLMDIYREDLEKESEDEDYEEEEDSGDDFGSEEDDAGTPANETAEFETGEEGPIVGEEENLEHDDAEEAQAPLEDGEVVDGDAEAEAVLADYEEVVGDGSDAGEEDEGGEWDDTEDEDVDTEPEATDSASRGVKRQHEDSEESD